MSIIMPEREFLHPVAREIVIERRKLMAEPAKPTCSEALRNIARNRNTITTM